LTRPPAKTAQRLRNPAATPPSALRSHASRLPVCLAALTVVLVATLATSATVRAEAEDSAAVEKVTKLNKKAVDEYQNLNFEEARKLLKNAIDVCTQSNLENHPVTARTYVHLGIVTFNGFKQRDEAVKQFKKALEIQGDIKLDKILATPETQEVFDEAVAGMKEVKPPEPPRTGGGIEHDPVSKSKQGQPITITAKVDPALGAKKVVLSFSADGADDFAEKEMKEDPPGTFTAEIPASATQGGIVDYFIEALGDNDNALATKGSANKTMKIAMLDANGAPLVTAPRKGGKKTEKKTAEADETPTWFFGLGIGSGVGWATGKGEVNSQDVVKPAGFAMSKLVHFTPEVGYYVAPDLLVSVQLRFQLITGANEYHSASMTECGDGICSPGTYAFAGFARASYFFGEGDLRTYVAGTAGLGTIRHVAAFESQQNCGTPAPGMTTGNQTCIDTVPSGPIFVGGGAGIMYSLSPAVALTLGTNALVGFTKFTYHVDLNAGLAFEY
jgi:Tetratricopeptide repeat